MTPYHDGLFYLAPTYLTARKNAGKNNRGVKDYPFKFHARGSGHGISLSSPVPFRRPYFRLLTDSTQASLALSSDETPVGCVFVHDGTIIGRGMNATNRTYNGTRHAEFIAIDDILSRRDENRVPLHSPEILTECDLYVTVEPCIMCASLLRQLGVRKVYFGAGNEKFGGTGGVLNIHRANGRRLPESGEMADANREMWEKGDYEVSGGWLREEAIVMLRRFYVQENGRGEFAISFGVCLVGVMNSLGICYTDGYLAPEPRSKRERILKLEVEPIVEGKRTGDG
jgi:tRNA-specific adenosine deaminase 2